MTVKLTMKTFLGDDIEQELTKTRLTDVKARCDNEANDNSLCFDAKTPATLCSADTGAPVWCRTSQARVLAGLAFVEGGWHGQGDIRHSDSVSRTVDTSATDCRHLRNKGITANDVYTVQLKSGMQIQVYFDMQTDGGGWTVFQNRFNGYLDFSQNLTEYESGFGDLSGEFWMGLRYVQEMANLAPTELRLEVSTMDRTTFYSVYQNFHLGSDNRYQLNIDARTGSEPIYNMYATLNVHKGSCFSTPDRDCDGDSQLNYAFLFQAGWWLIRNYAVQLNGVYMIPGIDNYLKTGGITVRGGMFHYAFNKWKALSASKMMFRRVPL